MTHQDLVVQALMPAVPGAVEVRLAESRAEIEAAQRIRYRVFYEEMGAKPTALMRNQDRDFDEYDDVCDHLLVLAEGEVVGTYRLIHRAAAARIGHFYSEGEFDLSALLATSGPILELGRSCVDARWRHRGTLQMLWQGLAAYMVENDIRLLFGCGSLPGTDPAALGPQIAYLRDNHLAPPSLRGRALSSRDRIDFASVMATWDARRVLASLPPLLKGYLRLGGMVGDGAIIDHQFNTTDVLVVVSAADIAGRYVKRFNV
ncbi:GNAT family N-acetyltransferase [Magnetospirillum molischianum]|uniref:L-ornithine N(alpha)-acyltransferase n=1 Tax=Magnetospirillum molischianum DSM 120 TaxID=1150626 RepID=H8FNM2_MAGML|nr:GNAT family N-acyltransferase [Magnetospirillum molischianum]CCG39960.1 putative hemolysin [Magnetospirillum molischianum DSM 120]